MSRQTRVPAALPVGGYRPDLERFSIPATGLQQARNVIVVDGALRPRPQLSENSLETKFQWQSIDRSGMPGAAVASFYGMVSGPWSPRIQIGTYQGGACRIQQTEDLETWTSVGVYSAGGDYPIDMDLNVANNRYEFVTEDAYIYYRTINDPYNDFTQHGQAYGVANTARKFVIDPDDSGYCRGMVIIKDGSTWRLRFTPDLGLTVPLASWSNIEVSTSLDIMDLCCGGSYWIMLVKDGTDTRIYRQKSSATMTSGGWVLEATVSNLTLDKVAYARSGHFIAVGMGASGLESYYSTSYGDTWIEGPYDPTITRSIAALAWGPDYFIVIDLDGNSSYTFVEESRGSYNPGWTPLPTFPYGGYIHRMIVLGTRTVFVSTTGYGIYTLPAPNSQVVTGHIQYDAEKESDQLVIGLSGGLARLHKSTRKWIDLTRPTDPLTASPFTSTVMRTFDKGGTNYVILTNGINSPKAYKSGDPFYRDIEGDPPKAIAMLTLAGRVVLCGLVGGANASLIGVDCSDLNNFDAGWGMVQVSQLGDTPGPIVAAEELSALEGVIYKTDSIVHIQAQDQFLGTSAPFRFQTMQVGICGPCGPRAVCRLDDGTQVYLARDGSLQLYDGVRVRDCGYHIRKAIADSGNLDPKYLTSSLVALDAKRRVLWVVPGYLTRINAYAIQLDQGWPWPIWPMLFTDSMSHLAEVTLAAPTIIGDLTNAIGAYTNTIGGWSGHGTHFLCFPQRTKLGSWYQEWRSRYFNWQTNPSWYPVDEENFNFNWQSGFLPVNEDVNAWFTVHEVHNYIDQANNDSMTISVSGDPGGVASAETVSKTLSDTAAPLGRVGFRVTSRRFALGYSGIMTKASSSWWEWHGADVLMTKRGRR